MKFHYYPLPENEPRAMKQLFENIAMGAWRHTLSKKLLARFSEARGPVLVIAYESLDIDRLTDFEYATYAGGRLLDDLIDPKSFKLDDSHIYGLAQFINRHLEFSKSAVAICENWAARPESLVSVPRESRTACYRDEVYHILTADNAGDLDSIETAIRESRHHWVTGVCSFCDEVPQGDIPSDAFLDSIVERTAHIFGAAFDDEGYIVWSPTVTRRSTPGTTATA
jgi:hypothetical protein